MLLVVGVLLDSALEYSSNLALMLVRPDVMVLFALASLDKI